ncbi:MAG: ABC transporter permease [archaeon]|nr:ABC transporter permease [archaeon]
MRKRINNMNEKGNKEENSIKLEKSVEQRKIFEPFSFLNVKRIFLKDWIELKYNKEIIAMIFLLPIIFSIGMPLLMGLPVLFDPDSLNTGDSPMTAYIYTKVIIIDMMVKPMFLLIPMMVSMYIAADAFAGEKERKTAETLLVMPITHKELFLGKLLASFIPSMVFTIVSFFLTGIVVNIMSSRFVPVGEPILVFGDLSFWLIAFCLGTLISLVDIQITLIISSRSKDVKTAQNLAGVLTLPVIGIMISSMILPLLNNVVSILILAAVLAIIMIILIQIGSKVISRERLIANIG